MASDSSLRALLSEYREVTDHLQASQFSIEQAKLKKESLEARLRLLEKNVIYDDGLESEIRPVRTVRIQDMRSDQYHHFKITYVSDECHTIEILHVESL